MSISGVGLGLLVRRLGLLGIAVVLAWKIIAMGLSNYTMEQAVDSDNTSKVDELARQAAAERALQWNPANRRALLVQATGNMEKWPELAQQQLQRLLQLNPGDGRAMVLLAVLALQNKEEKRADRLMTLATRLMPANGPVHIDAARYWWQRKNIPLALQNWSEALSIDNTLSKTIYPILLAIAENDKVRPALQGIIKNPPLWWPGFFTFLSQRAIRNETVELVYLMRRKASTPLSSEERLAYVQRQRRDGHFTRAYMSWLNGLDKEQRRQLGQLYNGNFELNISNSGYGWHVRAIKGVVVSQDFTTEVIGKRALHLQFQDREIRYANLYQPLFLRPAHYQLRGRIQLERLDGRGGLQWVVRCSGKKPQILGKSERFLGTLNWQAFTVDFTVPTRGCVAPELRLYSTGLRTFDHKLEGGVWFDAMSIRTVTTPASSS